MKIKLTSVLVDDQDKALKTHILGFGRRISLGIHNSLMRHCPDRLSLFQ